MFERQFPPERQRGDWSLKSDPCPLPSVVSRLNSQSGTFLRSFSSKAGSPAVQESTSFLPAGSQTPALIARHPSKPCSHNQRGQIRRRHPRLSVLSFNFSSVDCNANSGLTLVPLRSWEGWPVAVRTVPASSAGSTGCPGSGTKRRQPRNPPLRVPFLASDAQDFHSSEV